MPLLYALFQYKVSIKQTKIGEEELQGGEGEGGGIGGIQEGGRQGENKKKKKKKKEQDKKEEEEEAELGKVEEQGEREEDGIGGRE